MRLIAISISPSRIYKLQNIYRQTVEVFPGTEGCTAENYRDVCIPDAHHRQAQAAVAERLGLETVVMQDDVLLPTGGDILDRTVADADSELIVFGQTESTGIVVPKAWTATPRIWKLIAAVWTGVGKVGPAWMPIVESEGVVLDITRNIGE